MDKKCEKLTGFPHMVTTFPEQVTERISAAIVREFGHWRNAAKVLAAKTDTNPRSVQNWLYGVNAPRLAEAIALAAECDAVADEIMAMIAERKAQRCSRST